MRTWSVTAVICVAAATGGLPTKQPAPDNYLSWSIGQAEAAGKQMYKKGRVGGFWDTRKLKTERAYNYKLAATWLTPDVIRATARLIQLRSRLSDIDARALVNEAEAAGDTIVMVEIDPREGSGVIPKDWVAFLQPAGRPEAGVRGTLNSHLRDVRALAGVLPRNYDYDRFWLTFPLKGSSGASLFSATDANAELVVRISEKEGHVEWPIPSSVRH